MPFALDSSREAYCSPTRGAQGKCGETTIESQGVAHRTAFSIDPIRQEPRIVRVCEASSVKNGTRVAVSWPVSAKLNPP
jgi:hypothetical protein